MEYKIIIVDYHKIVRQGIKNLIEKLSFVESVIEASDGIEAIELVKKHAPDIVIMDIAMSGMNGIEATYKILELYPSIKIIILSMHFDRSFVMEALKAGAKSYLLKEDAFEELSMAIKAVISDKPYLSARIADLVLKEYINRDQSTSVFKILTSREREVLQILAEGKSSKIIASSLRVSIKTIEAHRQQIMNKLNIHSIAELTKYAIREGLTSA